MHPRHLTIYAFLTVALIARNAEAQTETRAGKPAESKSTTLVSIEDSTGTSDSDSDEEAESGLSETLSQLLKQLESPTFATRQKAASDLLKQDASAVGVLETQLDVVSPGVQTQLRVLIPRLRKRLFNDVLDAFSASPVLEHAAKLPEWNRFSELAGDREKALAIFRELLLAEQDLFAARMFGAADFSKQLEARSAAFSVLCDGREEEDFPIVTCAALMLLASDPEIRLTGRTSTNLSNALDDPRLDALMVDGVHVQILRSIVSAWIVRPDIAVDRPLLFAMRHQLPAGRTTALQSLARARQNQSTYYSLLCLGVLNSTDDLPVVEALLTADKKLWPPRGQVVSDLLPDREVESTFSVQTRDVALAVALHLRKQSPEDFGISVTASDLHLFSIESMGFNSDDERDAALQKYRSQFPARD
jgi:hypothetical protein